ncbi:MAG: ATP-dependent helicase, partial [Clostridiales bacterium]|nr:ATP-dependent helicase [Clostridiales bacterium]
KNDFLELTENGGVIVGLKGEKFTKSFKFFAVFKDDDDFSVKCESNEIGTISSAPPIGDRFALAGRVWEIEDVDLTRKLIYVHGVEGKMEIEWPGDYGEIHTKILERMKKILLEDTVYPYLGKNAAERLESARRIAENCGFGRDMVINLGGNARCLTPWLGTRSFRTLRRVLKKNAGQLGIAKIEYEGCCYITFKSERSPAELEADIKEIVARGIDVYELVGEGESPAFDKYDTFIPAELLRRAFALDRLRADEIIERFK